MRSSSTSNHHLHFVVENQLEILNKGPLESDYTWSGHRHDKLCKGPSIKYVCTQEGGRGQAKEYEKVRGRGGVWPKSTYVFVTFIFFKNQINVSGKTQNFSPLFYSTHF